MKIQTRIAVLFASVTAGMLLFAGIALYYFINSNTFDDFYKRLEIRAVIAAKLAVNESGKEVYASLRRQHLAPLPDEREEVIALDASGRVTGKSRLATILPQSAIQTAFREGTSTARVADRFYYLRTFSTGTRRFLMVVSAENAQSIRYLNQLRRTMIIAFPVSVLLAFSIGILFSKSVLRPIRNITANVRNLSAENLHIRLETKESTDEIAELAATFNNMLDRLETAFETQNNFVSHASHEFNTPLTAIIGEAEYALARPRSEAQYIDSLSGILESAEKLSGITRSLLQMAQTGMSGRGQKMVPLRADALVRKVKKMVDGIIPANAVTLNTSLAPADAQKLTILGDGTLLELALANVVLNACKYSNNGPVQIALGATHDRVLILVEDRGIGIPDGELRHIYDPFFRASNAGGFKGYGIGLPLTRNIIRLHRGEIRVQSQEGAGTEVQILLPRAAEG